MDDQQRITMLEEALREARIGRDAARRKAVNEAEKADIWQERAEERAARIERILSARATPVGRLRAGVGRMLRPASLPPGSPSPAPSPAPRPISFPSIRIATLVADPILATIAAETDAMPVTDDPDALNRGDLVLIEAEELAAAGDPLRARLDEWLSSPARSPLIVVGAPGDLKLGPGDVAAGRAWREDNGSPTDAWAIPATFDASRWNPWRSFDDEAFAADFGRDLPVEPGSRSVAVAFDPTEPWMLAAAASGVAFRSADDDPAKRGVAARRIAYRDNAPWMVAEQVLDRAGIGHEPALPPAAGILVSMRPELLPTAIAGFAAQTYPGKELVVGCHGFPASAIADVVAAHEDSLPISVIEFDRTVPLGRCLNAAIASTSAPLVAKIDDDDFRGPAYLEDAAQANRYAQAPLIGKGAMFVYLEGKDETVMLHPDVVERFYDGSPNGASLVFERHLWEQVGFPHRTLGEDTAFVAGAKLIGARPYATSPYEFVYRRGLKGHTWSAVDDEFLERSAPAWPGDRPDLAVVDA
jgi:hypothetical protein